MRCHGETGAGNPDDSTPKIAGQHFTVVVKQLDDFLTGSRDGIASFTALYRALKNAQQMADIAEYLANMPVQKEAGVGPGANLALGQKLHERDCRMCHGEGGQGLDENFYPIIAGQHFNYLYTQIRNIALKTRRNSLPAMVTILEKYSAEEILALADYLSRLDWPKTRKEQ